MGNREVGSNAVKDAQMDAHYTNCEKYFPIDRNYSYDYGCAHFCVLDCPSMFEEICGSATDTYLPILKDDFENHEAYRFLEQDLDQSNTRLEFVVFHYPPYASSMYEVRRCGFYAAL